MRICLHTVREIKADFIGGTERLLVELSKELSDLGHEPIIVSSGMGGSTKIEGIPLLRIIPPRYREAYKELGYANSAFFSATVMRRRRVADQLRALGEYVDEQLRGICADVFHLNSFITAAFASSTDGAFVTNHENPREYDSKLGEGFTQSLASLVSAGRTGLGSARLLATPSRHYAHYFAERFGLPVSAVGAGVRLASFPKVGWRRLEARCESSVLRVLVPARFEPFQKGHDIAMHACKLLAERGVNVEFTFSGVRPDYEDRIEQFLAVARSLGIAGCVRAKRFTDMNDAYRACDVVVSPERYCSYGLAISESLALGLPTVLSDIPTYREIADGYGHAFFFGVEDATSLADRILEAASVTAGALDEEAIRFRVAYDLRLAAGSLHREYVAAIRNSTSL